MGNGASRRKTAEAAHHSEQAEDGKPQPAAERSESGAQTPASSSEQAGEQAQESRPQLPSKAAAPDGVSEQSDPALEVPALIGAAQTPAGNFQASEAGDSRRLEAPLKPTAPLSALSGAVGSAAAETTESCAPEIDASLSDAGRQREDSKALEQTDRARRRQRRSTPAVGTLHYMLAQEDATFLPVERQCLKPSGTSDPPGASHQTGDGYVHSDTAFLVLESFEYAGHCLTGTRVQVRDHDATADTSSSLDGKQGQGGASTQGHAAITERASVCAAADPDGEMLEQEIKFYRAKIRGFSQTRPLASNSRTPISDYWSRSTRYTKEEGGDNLTESWLPWGLGHVRYDEHAASQEAYLGSWAWGLPNGFGTHTYSGLGGEDSTFEGSFSNGFRDGLGIEISRVLFQPLPHMSLSTGKGGEDGGEGGDDSSRHAAGAEHGRALLPLTEEGVQGWSFYAGAWSEGQRHGSGVVGSVVLSQEESPDDLARTCLGHATNLQFQRSTLVQYSRGCIEMHEAAVTYSREDDLLWEACMENAIKGRDAGLAALAIAGPVFAEQQLIDEVEDGKRFREEMAATRGKAQTREQQDAAEAAAAAALAEEQEREREKQRQLQEQIAAEAEAQRALKTEEDARSQEAKNIQREVTWPCALNVAAMKQLSTCEERLVMRRLVEEISTTDPAPRLDLLQVLFQEFAEERQGEGKRMREIQRLRREEETRTMELVQNLWEELAADIIREILVGEGGVAQALDELVEDEEDERRWAEEELVAEEVMQRRREEEAAADARLEEAEDSAAMVQEEEAARMRDAQRTQEEHADKAAAEALAAKEKERQRRSEARERGRKELDKAHEQCRRDLKHSRDEASKERAARQEARERQQAAQKKEQERRKDEMSARQEAAKARCKDERQMAEEEEAMLKEQIAMIRESQRKKQSRRVHTEIVAKLEEEEKKMRAQQDPLGLGMSEKSQRSPEEQAAFDSELKHKIEKSMQTWEAQRAKEEAEEEAKRLAEAERAEEENRRREEEEDAAEAERSKQLEEQEDKILAEQQNGEREREEREEEARAKQDAKEEEKMAADQAARAAKDAQEAEEDAQEQKHDESQQQAADRNREERERKERDEEEREKLAADAEKERRRMEREARQRLREERDRREREGRKKDRALQEQTKEDERRRKESERREREQAEWAERAESSQGSFPGSSHAGEPQADLINQAYQAIFGAVGTSPLHALCESSKICDDLMTSVVEATCEIEVWTGEQVWEDGDALQLMAMSPCAFDKQRLPLHAGCSNGSCPATCLASVLQEYPEAVWKTDDQGMTPLALLCMSHPPPPLRSSSEENKAKISTREAQGERNQRWGIKPTLLDQRREEARRAADKTRIKSMKREAPLNESLPVRGGEEVTAVEHACALHLKLDVLLLGVHSARARRGPASKGPETGKHAFPTTYTSRSADSEICNFVTATVHSALDIGVDMAMSESWASGSRGTTVCGSEASLGLTSLVHDTLEQAVLTGVDLAVTPSPGGSSASGSIVHGDARIGNEGITVGARHFGTDLSGSSSASALTLPGQNMQRGTWDNNATANSGARGGMRVRGEFADGVTVDSRGQGEEHTRVTMVERQLRLCAAVCTDSGRLPLHLLCANHCISAAALRTLIQAAPFVAAVPDRHGLTALHVLCCNRRVTAELLGILLAAFPSAARLPCFGGFLPLHYLCSSPSADAIMLKLLLHHYPGAIDKVKGDATIMHLISGLRIDVASRRLRGGGLEGEEVDRQRRLKRFHMLQVAVEADNSFREFEFNLESGPRVGAQWTPVPRRINLVPETAGGKNRAGRGDLGAETRFRRQMPCVSLSVPERAFSLRGHLLEEIQAHRQEIGRDGASQSSPAPSRLSSPAQSPLGRRERELVAAEDARRRGQLLEEQMRQRQWQQDSVDVAAAMRAPLAAVVAWFITADPAALSRALGTDGGVQKEAAPGSEHAILLDLLSTLPLVTQEMEWPGGGKQEVHALDAGGGRGGTDGEDAGGGGCGRGAVYMAWLIAYVETLLASRLAHPPSSSPHLPATRSLVSGEVGHGGETRKQANEDTERQTEEARCHGRLAYRLQREMMELEKKSAGGAQGGRSMTPGQGNGCPEFLFRHLEPSLVLLGAYLEHAYGQDDQGDCSLPVGVGSGDGGGGHAHGVDTADGDTFTASCQRAVDLCDSAMAALAPAPGVLRPDRKGNLPLHILCSKDGVLDEEVGVLIREAPHTSACRDAAGRLPLALLCSHSSSFDACRTLEEAFPRALIFPDLLCEEARGGGSSIASPALVHSLPIAALYSWAQEGRPRRATWVEEHDAPLQDPRAGVACLGGRHSGRPLRPHRQEDARLGKGRPGW